jgi:hypothetical protein
MVPIQRKESYGPGQWVSAGVILEFFLAVEIADPPVEVLAEIESPDASIVIAGGCVGLMCRARQGFSCSEARMLCAMKVAK